jgi:hypothetical protein
MNHLRKNAQLKGLDRKNKGASRKACANFSLYIFSIAIWEGQMGHSPRVYLPNKTNSLREKGDAQGLDKFSGGQLGARAD